MTRLHFTDGRTFTVPASWSPAAVDNVAGLDAAGHPIGWGGFHYGSTLCCGASFTGTDDGPVCRACYGLDPDGADGPVGEIAIRVVGRGGTDEA